MKLYSGVYRIAPDEADLTNNSVAATVKADGADETAISVSIQCIATQCMCVSVMNTTPSGRAKSKPFLSPLAK